jgi:hypothetical protein
LDYQKNFFMLFACKQYVSSIVDIIGCLYVGSCSWRCSIIRSLPLKQFYP